MLATGYRCLLFDSLPTLKIDNSDDLQGYTKKSDLSQNTWPAMKILSSKSFVKLLTIMTEPFFRSTPQSRECADSLYEGPLSLP
jgi:hypothetical protein